MVSLSIAASAYALLVSGLVGRYANGVGKALGVMDWPDRAGGRKLHASVTPLVGGTGVILSIFGAILLTLGTIGTRDVAVAGHLATISLSVFAIYAIGLTDDRIALSARVRLAISAAVLLMALISDPTLQLQRLDFGAPAGIDLGRFGLAFTLLCLVGLLNAVNMADGKNGLVISLCLIWSGVLLVHAPDYWQPPLLAGISALLTMLWFNMRGHLFLGDSGSYGLSAFVGLLTVAVYNGSSTLSAGHILVMFAVPVIDTVRLMVSRKLRGMSPLEGDRDHFHHHLFNRWGWPGGLPIYAGLVGLPTLAVQLMPSATMPALAAMLLGYVVLLVMTRRAAVDPVTTVTVASFAELELNPIRVPTPDGSDAAQPTDRAA